MDERKLYRITIEGWDDCNKSFIAHRIQISCDPSTIHDVLNLIKGKVSYFKAESQSKLHGISTKW